MGYEHIVFDIDGTLVDTEYSILASLQRTVKELTHREMEIQELYFALGITGADALARLQITEREEALQLWIGYMEELSGSVKIFDGIRSLLDTLAEKSYHLGIISSQYRAEFDRGFVHLGLEGYFETIVLGDDTKEHKPTSAPMECYLNRTGADPKKVLYIGDSPYDMQCARSAGTDCALALWGCRSQKHIPADYYMENPQAVADMLARQQLADERPWMSWAMELQFIAQAGITYSKDVFDIERFERIREISAEIMCMKTGYSKEFVKDVFCSETGFQTPKLDCRAAVFDQGKILLVKERDGRWSLPGGWVDVNQSVKMNTIKEVKEEAGLDVVPERLIALHDRNLHNKPPYAYGICKVFFQCRLLGGEFEKNIETQEIRYFALDEIPELAEEKVSLEQIKMCFQAYECLDWAAVFD